MGFIKYTKDTIRTIGLSLKAMIVPLLSMIGFWGTVKGIADNSYSWGFFISVLLFAWGIEEFAKYIISNAKKEILEEVDEKIDDKINELKEE
jgi:hypothetical protein